MKRTLYRFVQRLLAAQGYALIKLPRMSRSMEDTIRTLADTHTGIQTIVDIGASDGRWSAQALRHFPSCNYLLIEAQSLHEKALQRLCRTHPRCSYVLAAAGNASGYVAFFAPRPLGGYASFVPPDSPHLTVPMTTVDQEVEARHLQGPFLLKLDTHGFEVPILEGAADTLQHTEVIIMECYNFKLTSECLLFFEMCAYLKPFGFRPRDLVDPLYRQSDQVLWQMDLVFTKEDRPEFSTAQFR